MNILEVKNLKTYFKTPNGVARAVDDINFTLQKGRTLAIVGESGCGKSVTSLSILGLLPDNAYHETGEVNYHGENILKSSHSTLKKIRGKKISMIFQEPGTALNPVFTIGYQLLECFSNGLSKKENKTRILKALKDVGIADANLIYSQYPHQLSGGMKQRVMICMALLSSPDILIADEPTTALDVTIQAQILTLMKGLQTKYETSILFITHDLGVVAEMADDVCVMYAGKIVEKGSVSSILKKPKHPYTKALIASLPSEQKMHVKRAKLMTINGQVPPATHYSNTCRFFERCQIGTSICQKEEPKLLAVSDKVFVACHNT